VINVSRTQRNASAKTYLVRFVFSAVLLLTAGYTFLDYWAYSKIEHANPGPWIALAHGTGLAPAQYRIGIYLTANRVENLTHLHDRYLFAAADCFSTAIGLTCIFLMLGPISKIADRGNGTRDESRIPADANRDHWALIFLALFLAQLYLVWTLWFQEPETMPSFAILAVSALCYSGFTNPKPAIPKPAIALSILLLTTVGSTVRADTVVALQAGVLLASLAWTGKTPDKDRQRPWLVATSLISLLTAVAVESLIAHRLFPHAVRSAPAFQLLDNLHALNGALALLCTLPPWILTLWLSARQWPRLPLWLRGLIVGSAIHLLLFLTFGMSEEVRIFLPFTLTLIPLSATLIHGWLLDPETASR